MTFEKFRQAITSSVFTTTSVSVAFPLESPHSINISLYRFARSKKIVSIKRGLYKFLDSKIDEFALAGILYTPSYVSMESVLNSCGVIPDIPLSVTSVTTTTSKKIVTSMGNYFYSKIPLELYFGFEKMADPISGVYYNIATPEKALLDYLYVRRIKNLANYRIDLTHLNRIKLTEFIKHYPLWLQRILP
ncbi:MAG: hypothetical protein ABII16_01585 [Patescibacteria group bacterium]